MSSDGSTPYKTASPGSCGKQDAQAVARSRGPWDSRAGQARPGAGGPLRATALPGPPFTGPNSPAVPPPRPLATPWPVAPLPAQPQAACSPGAHQRHWEEEAQERRARFLTFVKGTSGPTILPVPSSQLCKLEIRTLGHSAEGGGLGLLQEAGCNVSLGETV